MVELTPGVRSHEAKLIMKEKMKLGDKVGVGVVVLKLGAVLSQ